MKLNEVTQGKKIWVIANLEEGGRIDDLYLTGAYSSFKAADNELKNMWIGWVEDEDEGLAKKLKAAINNDKQFEKLAEEAEGPFPRWDDLFEFYVILETNLK
jgi:hypothetical protein